MRPTIVFALMLIPVTLMGITLSVVGGLSGRLNIAGQAPLLSGAFSYEIYFVLIFTYIIFIIDISDSAKYMVNLWPRCCPPGRGY